MRLPPQREPDALAAAWERARRCDEGGAGEMGNSERHVFFDPSGRRARLVSSLGKLVAATLLAVIGGLLIGIIETPILPKTALLEPKRPVHSDPDPRPAVESVSKFDARRNRVPTATALGKAKRYGFYVNWDENSFSSLTKNARNLDVVIAEWLHMDGPNGGIRRNDLARERKMRAWLADKAPRLEVLPLINNYDSDAGEWDSDALGELLASPEARRKMIANLLKFVQEGNFPGAVIDFERLRRGDPKLLTVFMREMSAVFKPLNLKVLAAVPPGGEEDGDEEDGFEYEELAAVCNQLILMVYDEHHEGSKPGPVASQGWFERQLDARFKNLSGSKLIVGVASYGYDWTLDGSGNAEDVTVQSAWDLLDDSGAALAFDHESLNPTFSYVNEEDGKRHVVWFLDAATMFNHTAAALAMEPHGVALWRLGAEDPSVWPVFGRERVPNKETVNGLKTLNSGYDLSYKGQGEALQVTGLEKAGARTIEYAAEDNLITNEAITAFPKSATISRWGARQDKVVALTFDDGPDPNITPAILDVLAQKGVHASFFVIGANANAAPDILRRIYAEGHDIGNHTYTHPNLAEIPSAEVDLELNATQRAIEAAVGVHTLLFRPPYMGDIAPETVDHMRPLLNSTALGYVTISSGIDPLDWDAASSESIVDAAVKQIEKRLGNVVLLHDSGGDRRHTIAALPKLIDALRAKGYRFVTIPELLNLSRDELMPKAEPDTSVKTVGSAVNRAGFGLLRWAGLTLSTILWVGVALGALRLAVVAVFATLHSRAERKRRSLAWSPPSLAVVIPAYNEEKVICGTIRSLLASKLKTFDIIVVDDGSTDGTAAAVREAFGHAGRVQLLAKENGGKADALNHGVAHTDAEIIVIADADTIFEPDALPELTRHFADPRMGAVAGAVKVGNRVNWISRFQALEYVTSQNLDRRALELLGGMTVVPGCIGAWRRSALMETGGFSSQTLAEDADATMRIQRQGWRVIYEPRAVALTEAPQSTRAFLRQRLRWMYGSLQAAFKHRSALWRGDAKGLAFIALPNIIIFQVLFTLISPVIDLALAWNLAMCLRSYLMHPEDSLSGNIYTALAFWAFFQLIEFTAAGLAFALDRTNGRWWRLMPLVLIQRFCYRQLLYWVAMVTMARALKGHFVGWNKLRRTGTVAAQAAVGPGGE
jgi:cellulose synthase/poly-beta-1,6-N-acetylglucosamine synthase-like glycosyltransferase/peptidoglycan/xylan/chitin deacetylase (PgdA/CDA1 family)/spore germination protein YaaH